MTLYDVSGKRVDNAAKRAEIAAAWLKQAQAALCEAFGVIHGLRPADMGGGQWPPDDPEAKQEHHRDLVCQSIMQLVGVKRIEDRFGLEITIDPMDEPTNGNGEGQ